MKRHESEYRTMFLATHEVLVNYKAVWQNNAVMASLFSQLENYLDEISNCSSTQLRSIEGLFIEQTKLRERLTTDGFHIKEVLRFNFDMTGSMQEKERFTYPVSDLIRATKDRFYVLMLGIVDAAVDNAAGLNTLNVSNTEINAFSQRVSKFYDVLNKIEKRQIIAKQSTSGIAEKINACRIMLNEKLDMAMQIYSTTNKEMVSKYKLARRLMKIGGKRKYYTVIISGKITDNAAKKPLAGVTVTPADKGKMSLSDDKGAYMVKMYKKNARKVVFTCKGYEPFTVMLEQPCTLHKITVNVALKKVTPGKFYMSVT